MDNKENDEFQPLKKKKPSHNTVDRNMEFRSSVTRKPLQSSSELPEDTVAVNM